MDKEQLRNLTDPERIFEREKSSLEAYINTICFAGEDVDLILTQGKAIDLFNDAEEELEALRLKLLTRLKNL